MLETLLAWDESTFLAINDGLSAAWLDPVMIGITHLGDGITVTVALLFALFLCGRKGLRARFLFMVLGVGLGALVVQGAKFAVARARPAPTFEARARAGTVPLHLVGSPPKGHTSWPSGHSQGAFGAALVLGELFRRWRWPLIALATLVGLSRIYVGAHFPLDVLSGAALGIGGAIGAIALWRRTLARESPADATRA
jgi:undecaprenyl-diphosphatase